MMAKANIFESFLEHPTEITPAEMADLEYLCLKYPYCQPLKALLLKGLKNRNSFRFKDALRLTSLYTAHREALFSFIENGSFPKPENEHPPKESISVEVKQIDAETKQAPIDELLLVEQIEQKAIEAPDSSVQEKPQKPTKKKTEPAHHPKSDSMMSFEEWLALYDKGKKKPTPPKSTASKAKKAIPTFESIERKAAPDKPDKKVKASKTVNLAKNQHLKKTELMTETLAEAYLSQEKFTQAIDAYKILILKNPEKSTFFAEKIKQIRILKRQTT